MRSATVLAAVTVLVAVVAGSVGFTIGAARTPDALASAPPPATFPVVMEPFDDGRQINVVPTLGPAATVTTRRGGTITRTSCSISGTVASGTSPWSIDGAPVLALATSQPLYRDLKKGVKGRDVTVLQRELARLGYTVKANGVYDRATERAVAALRKARGLGKSTALRLGDVAWLAEPQLTMASCAALGSEIAPGGTLGQARPRLIAAKVNPVPSDLVPGRRTLTVGDLAVAVDATGAVGAADLAALGALPLTTTVLEAQGQGVAVTLPGTLTLADPLRTATIPASAVIATGPLTCVASGGTTTPVQVVSSRLGQSVISFGTATPPATVDLQPGSALTCG